MIVGPPQPRRSVLDRPLARVIAAAVFLGCAAALVYLERERLWPAGGEQTATDAPFVRCFVERAAQIDQMLADDLIKADQAALFKGRAEAMCRAESPGAGAPAPLGQ